MPAESNLPLPLPHEPRDPADYLPPEPFPWLWLALGLLAVLALGLYLLRKKHAAAPPAADADETRRQLEKLREEVARRPLAELASAISLSLRAHLAEHFREPLLWETLEETRSRPRALERLPASLRGDLATLLADLDAAKYAPSAPAPAAATPLLERSLALLDQLRPGTSADQT